MANYNPRTSTRHGEHACRLCKTCQARYSTHRTGLCRFCLRDLVAFEGALRASEAAEARKSRHDEMSRPSARQPLREAIYDGTVYSVMWDGSRE